MAQRQAAGGLLIPSPAALMWSDPGSLFLALPGPTRSIYTNPAAYLAGEMHSRSVERLREAAALWDAKREADWRVSVTRGDLIACRLSILPLPRHGESEVDLDGPLPRLVPARARGGPLRSHAWQWLLRALYPADAGGDAGPRASAPPSR